MIEVRRLSSFPPNSNPFLHELYLMGTYISDNVCVMHATHPPQFGSANKIGAQNASYIDVVNVMTGERVRLIFGPGNHGHLNDVFDVNVLLKEGEKVVS